MQNTVEHILVCCHNLLAGKVDLITGAKELMRFCEVQPSPIMHDDTIVLQKFLADLEGMLIPKNWAQSQNIPPSLKRELVSMCELYQSGVEHSCHVILDKLDHTQPQLKVGVGELQKV